MTAAPIRPALAAARRVLASAGVGGPDAELLLGHLLGLARGGVAAMELRDGAVDSDVLRDFARLVARRAERVPLQHLTGVAPFRHLELAVGPGAFVPRPETELTAGVAIDALVDAGEGAIAVDLGTGSGAIACALASEAPAARVYGVELSADALPWARRNAAPFPNLTIVEGDLADALPELDGTVAVVVSNPPYVPDDAIPRDPEVRLHDPALALYGGPDGLEVVRRVIASAARLLAPGGHVVIEHGELQGAAVRDLLAGWTDARTLPDLTGRDRITTALALQAGRS